MQSQLELLKEIMKKKKDEKSKLEQNEIEAKKKKEQEQLEIHLKEAQHFSQLSKSELV